MRAVLEEEARAGWVLVEKFDDSRLRLKRPQSARAADDSLDFDPYRTQLGMSDGSVALVSVGIGCGVMALLGVIVTVLVLVNRR
jgi:hypothetical protein